MITEQQNTALNAAVTEVVTAQLVGKKFWQSKTFWANIILGGAIIVQANTGFFITPELQTLILVGVNLALRKLTKDPIVW